LNAERDAALREVERLKVIVEWCSERYCPQVGKCDCECCQMGQLAKETLAALAGPQSEGGE